MKILDLEFKPYKKEEEIKHAVKKLGKKLTRDYENRDPLFLVILNGAFIFAADLFRELKIPAEVSFIKLSSYPEISSSGHVRELIGLNHTIFNRNIIILEDIIDTGLTLQHTLEALQDLGAASIEVVALFIKPESFKKKTDIRYVGFEIPNEFIVGYGLDYQGFGRNLKDVFIKK
ncbi:MAG: hypoxanthine phosphoribosyltransferase [Cyclobacteriaceae bacterium]|nr:hypoxanthine phosphoribosyltransferase [Cyclobacteriaceae bacterium]